MTSTSLAVPLISILIPAHNWQVGTLLDALSQQALADGRRELVDIHVFDDASEHDTARANASSVDRLCQCGLRAEFHRTERNLGRSAARNALIARSRGSHLLFLDADVLPDPASFLCQYLDLARAGAGAACGGISYAQCQSADAQTRFYLRYSGAVSVAPAHLRMDLPWAWLYTANVLVARALVAEVPFDDAFVGYGYEDIEWGIRLSRTGRLQHIDNPVTHLGLLSKATLQRKMRESTPNLVRLAQRHPDLAGQLRLVRLAMRLRRLPAWALSAGAAAAGAAFAGSRGPYGLELAAFQLEKLLLGAGAFKAAQG